MGRPNNNNQHHHQQPGQIQSSAITHFSHPHPLHIFSHTQIQTRVNTAPCSVCKVGFSPEVGTIYGCTACSFFLHASCSKLPQQIKHPVDPFHVLVLLPVPIYPQGFFICNACGKHCNSFSYNCRVCNIDLHTNCASMPLTRTHPAHPHQLSLAFSAPYPNNIFSCDVCGTPGTSEWLYRCNPCGFDSHLLCTETTSPQNSANRTHQYSDPANGFTRATAPTESYYSLPPTTPTAQNLIQQQLLEQQRAAAAISLSQAQMLYSQTVPAVPRRNIQANVNYFRGNQLQGLFARMHGILGNTGGGDGGTGMSDPGNSSDGCFAGDGGGGGLDFGSGFGDLGGSLGGIDLGSLGGMDVGSLGDLGGGLGDFSF